MIGQTIPNLPFKKKIPKRIFCICEQFVFWKFWFVEMCTMHLYSSDNILHFDFSFFFDIILRFFQIYNLYFWLVFLNTKKKINGLYLNNVCCNLYGKPMENLSVYNHRFWKRIAEFYWLHPFLKFYQIFCIKFWKLTLIN